MIQKFKCLFKGHDYTGWQYFSRMGLKRRNCRRGCGSYQLVETIGGKSWI